MLQTLGWLFSVTIPNIVIFATTKMLTNPVLCNFEAQIFLDNFVFLNRMIVITGPESSGKTSLSEALSERMGWPLVEEYARAYLSELDRPYDGRDILHIAQAQQSTFETYLGKRSFIADTAHLVLSIWYRERYGTFHPLIEDYYDLLDVDLYVLCKPDMPWEPDVLREHPNDRDRLYDLYRDRLIQDKKPFIELCGSLRSRIQKLERILV